VPLPDTDARIVDLKDGVADMPVGEQGELILRGPQIMSGYLNKPEETANAIRNGWFYTGDIAYMDEDGYFYIVDRKKDMINVAGFKVWPRDVEEVLYRHEGVKMAAVIGVHDPYRGESILAAIVPKRELSIKAADEFKKGLDEYCRESMASFKVPHRIELCEMLPLSTAGKILRRKLREIYAS
jgi:long-chain acyl-CoA synthetase